MLTEYLLYTGFPARGNVKIYKNLLKNMARLFLVASNNFFPQTTMNKLTVDFIDVSEANNFTKFQQKYSTS